ncbi:ABC-F family ATP-binding cassette domain-containing protein [Pseudorhodoplanes sinuspersici]|uniref:ATP-binding protein Uup n=1 Tax=Pseudorhodoplanes sinuspersici TaxID=1235591 RepID=A0A1W6ZN92_9HYPH|nr:ATP-binding cassette domain-containing protein [Pseudorhodoplanes sinuspersici]ARP98610.1 elongation factor 3 [Pseudorhodoplanes sinuspersici]RKE69808.1 ATP-binding cassette subfamily F protein uup [Pseudorhodoplanes sinuspersici]
MAPLIQLRDIGLTFGGTPLLTNAELQVSAGERVCLVGRNGSGKSTLLKITAGMIEPDRGTVFTQPGATIRYLPQEPDFSGHATTLSYVQAGLAPGDDTYQAQYLLEQLGLTGHEDPTHLSGGEARRAAIARVLAPSPDILLLDEPTNHLDLTTIEWLETELKSRRSALVIISHDRRFLDNLTRVTVWLDRGKTRRLEVGFRDFETKRDEILAEEELEQHKLDRKIAAEEDWVRYGVTARRKRNVRRMAELQALRKSRNDYRGSVGKAEITAAEADKSGTLVIEAKHISKFYDERPIVSDFSTRINRADRIGIVGPNGSGKTTLLSLLTGTLAPDSGSVRIGTNIEMASLEQDRDSLNPEWTLAEAMTDGKGDTVSIGGQTKHVVGYMKDFLFSPEQIRTQLRALSGGERGRLMLARALARPSNLLVLDEPTNDLDLETLDVLEETLSDYSGTVILISHDRDFLDRVVSSVIVPEGNGRWNEYAGGYSDMLAQRGADIASTKPVRNATAREQKAAAAAAAATKPKKKLNFNDRHALENLPKQIARLEGEIKTLQSKLDDPELYARDRKAFDAAMTAISKAQTDLAAAEEKWLELEMLREEVEGA